MNNNRSIKLSTLILATLIVLVAWMRLAGLGRNPLTDSEAVHALTAAATTPDASPFWDVDGVAAPVSASYYVFTTMIFHLFGLSDAAARVVSALAGLVLVLSPLILRKRIGTAHSLIAVLVLAIATSGWTIARTADGSALAATALVLFVFLAWSAESSDGRRVRLLLAAGALGFALASGPIVLQGLFGLLVAFGLSRILLSRDRKPFEEFKRLFAIKSGVWVSLVVMLLVASGVGFYWNGLAGLGGSLTEWLHGWTEPGTQSAIAYIVMLVSYEPLFVVMGIVGAVLAWRRKESLGQAASLWALGSLFSGLVYPARSAAEIVFVVLPLALLVAYTISVLIERISQRGVGLELVGLTGVLLVLTASAWISLVGYANGFILEYTPSDPGLILLVFSALIIMAVSLLLFFGLGWSWGVVADTLGIAATLVLAAITLSAVWRLNFTPLATSARELWRPEVTTNGMRLLTDTLDNASLAYAGRTDEIAVEVQSEVNPALAWALRGYNQAGGEFNSLAEPSPAVLALELNSGTNLLADYMGQGMALKERRDWEGSLPSNLLQWFVLRSAPTELERWILWVRMDIATLGDVGLTDIE
ncbi:MAG: hypothetical protein E3J69_04630 [Anaerolineales bacterium]|nr:MAG: hypothetical protein E3J69_04630 [Anaerolineales bacterium]